MSDDDWETDADFENDLTEAESRRAGSSAAAAELANHRNEVMNMDSIRNKGMSATALPASEMNRALSYQQAQQASPESKPLRQSNPPLPAAAPKPALAAGRPSAAPSLADG